MAHVGIFGRSVHSRDDAGLHTVGRRHRQSTVVGRGCVQRRRVLGVVAAIRAASPARSRSTRGQSSSCGGSSFLDCAGVVVLVACQGGTTRECLLAVGVWALVWPLARVDPTVPGQRTGVAEWLQNVLEDAKW